MMAVLARLAAAVVLLVAVGLALRPSLGAVTEALARAGWQTVVVMALMHAVPVLLCGAAWASLMPPWPVALFMRLRWIRDGFNELLALVPLAGEAAAMRLLARRGMAVGGAGAGMVADLTAEAAAQVVFTLAVLVLWSGHPGAEAVVRWGMLGVVAAVAMVGLFYGLQQGGGMRLLDWLAVRFVPSGLGLHGEISALYGRRRRVVTAFSIHLAAWTAACAEAWAGLALLGAPLSLDHVVMLEGLIFALRSAAFAVPGAWGVQEGAYALLAPLLGLGPDVAVTLSLLKRGREVLLGLPAIALWLWLSRRLPDGPAASPFWDRR